MKAKELAELLLEYPDQEVTVSVDISKGENDAGNRAFGEIVEFVNHGNELTLICRGETNCELEPYDKRLLHDLTRMWSDACEVARKYCPVEVGRDHLKDGIPRLAKRAAEAEAERDKLRKQIEDYKNDCLNVGSIHWAFSGDDYLKPLREVLNEKPYEELMKKIDTKLIEELSIASIVKANAELKKRVEVLEMAVEYLNAEKK